MKTQQKIDVATISRTYWVILQHDLTPRIYVLHKITIVLKFMSYINSDLHIPAKKLQTPG